MKRLACAPSPGTFSDPSFSADVIVWQQQHGRHHLPWQKSQDAYRVWLSEIMLQQTQVAAVIPYYQRFLDSFPDVQSLAAASSEQVMAHWSGLGYYSRARNLHACAQRVVAEFSGVFPDQPDLLESLPGIGRSTAAAIAAFSSGARAAILDGNVKRVFTRVFGISGDPAKTAVEQDLWLRAQDLLPDSGHQAMRSYTQGLMDLGATLCRRSKPLCAQCPLQQRCVALATDRIAELPTRKIKKRIPTRQIRMLILLDQDRVLLEKRPAIGIWGGLYSLPELSFDAASSADQVSQQIAHAVAPFGPLSAAQELEKISHSFTHFTLEITPYQCQLQQNSLQISEATHLWCPLQHCAQAPLPAPIKKLLLSTAANYSLL